MRKRSVFGISYFVFRLGVICFVIFVSYILASIYEIPPCFASGPSLSISPVLIEHTLAGKDEFSLPLKVRNIGSEDLTLSASPHQIEKQQKDGSVKYRKEPSVLYKQLFSTFKFSVDDEEITEINLLPQEEKIITLTGRVPDQQDYYFSIFLISKPLKKPLENSYSNVSIGIATHIFLFENNKKNNDVLISKYNIPTLLQKPPVPISLELNNQGSSVIKMGGKITFTNSFGKQVGTISLLPVYILPGSTRTMENFEENGQILPTLEWSQELLFGPFTATAQLSDDANTIRLERKTLFLVLPTGFLIALSVVFLIVLYVANRLRDHLRSI